MAHIRVCAFEVCCSEAGARHSARLPLADPSRPGAPPPTLLHCRRMLVKDPSQRITLPGIIAHPWFQRSMPPGLSELNARMDPEAKARQVRTLLILWLLLLCCSCGGTAGAGM